MFPKQEGVGLCLLASKAEIFFLRTNLNDMKAERIKWNEWGMGRET